jgi:hypothetical protein
LPRLFLKGKRLPARCLQVCHYHLVSLAAFHFRSSFDLAGKIDYELFSSEAKKFFAAIVELLWQKKLMMLQPERAIIKLLR